MLKAICYIVSIQSLLLAKYTLGKLTNFHGTYRSIFTGLLSINKCFKYRNTVIINMSINKCYKYYHNYCINKSKTRTMLTDALLLNVYVPVIEHVLPNLSTVVRFIEEGSSMIMHRLPQFLFSKFYLESIEMLCLTQLFSPPTVLKICQIQITKATFFVKFPIPGLP